MRDYDVIVVGGGHAGTEAAAAAARLGARTALMTHRRDTIGAMSCNPAIGGLGRGHLVREIDALDGIMGRAIDASGIQFRLLNRSKGAAVQGPRAQADRRLYAGAVRDLLAAQAGLDIVEAEAEEILRRGDRLIGVRDAAGATWSCAALVLTTGTFLRGTIFLGEERRPAGRMGDKSAERLSDSLLSLGLRLGRLKTGTPPRLRAGSIDLSALEEQPGDDPPHPFSFLTQAIRNPQVPCHITRTNERTHAIIRQHVTETPVYAGKISGTGVRYCPSIEDKVVRFPQRDGHQIFLEPEGLDDPLVYPNGISMAFAPELQIEILRSIAGLERVEMVRPGYAIEYDHVDPTQLDHRLAVRCLKGLFLAGQINGTTGYEEAAAQGIVAGANAALLAGNRETAFRVDRADGYIGVLVDDLVSTGVVEPYRMFTSRAEFRLTLRAGNADLRLTPRAIGLGLAGAARTRSFEAKLAAWSESVALLQTLTTTPSAANAVGLQVNEDGRPRTAFELLSRAGTRLADLERRWSELGAVPAALRGELETEAQYARYIARQQAEIAAFRRDETLELPADLAWSEIAGLSNEVRQRLDRVRPATIGAASRMPGMTPAGLGLLLRHARRHV